MQDLQYTTQKMEDSETMKILTTLHKSKSIFHCDHPDEPKEASGRQPVFHPVRTAYYMQTTRTWCSYSRPNNPADATYREQTQTTRTWCQDTNAVAANSGDVLHNRQDARASRPDALQQLMKNCCLPFGRPMSCPDAT